MIDFKCFLYIFDVLGLYADSDYASCNKLEWNPYGDGLMFEDLGMPVFLLSNETSVNLIKDVSYELISLFLSLYKMYIMVYIIDERFFFVFFLLWLKVSK